MDRESDLSREIACHLDMACEQFRSTGLSFTEARERALREFGDVDQVTKLVRDVWRRRWRHFVFATRPAQFLRRRSA